MSLDTTDAETVRRRIFKRYWGRSDFIRRDDLYYQMGGRPKVDPYGWREQRITAAIATGCERACSRSSRATTVPTWWRWGSGHEQAEDRPARARPAGAAGARGRGARTMGQRQAARGEAEAQFKKEEVMAFEHGAIILEHYGDVIRIGKEGKWVEFIKK